jgi:hypothetical protein
MPITKVPYGPRETTISHDRWLVVVTVVVWCPLRILYVLRHTWNRHVSVRQDSGDARAHQASLILSYCNELSFGSHYESSLWAQRNSHFTWLVSSYGNGRCLMPVTVTPGFKDKPECKNTCAPILSYTHASTQWIPKHSVKRKESIKQLLHDRMSQLNKSFE